MDKNSDLPGTRLLSGIAQELGVHLSTCHRWRMKGVSGHKLRCKKIGGRWYVTAHDLQQFVAAVTAAADRSHSSAKLDATPRAQRAAEEAGTKLDAYVFKRLPGRQAKRRVANRRFT